MTFMEFKLTMKMTFKYTQLVFSKGTKQLKVRGWVDAVGANAVRTLCKQTNIIPLGKRAQFRYNDKTCIWESGVKTITERNVKGFCMFNEAPYKGPLKEMGTF